MKREEVYQSDPEIVSGTPVFTGTRVPVQNLLDYLEGGDTLDDFLEGFPGVSKEQVLAVLEMAKDVLKDIKPGQKVEVMAYDGRLVFIPVKPMKEMRGFVKGVDTTIIREPDREL